MKSFRSLDVYCNFPQPREMTSCKYNCYTNHSQLTVTFNSKNSQSSPAKLCNPPPSRQICIQFSLSSVLFFLQQDCRSPTLSYNNDCRKSILRSFVHVWRAKHLVLERRVPKKTAQARLKKYILVQNIWHGKIDICSGFSMSHSPFFSILKMGMYCSLNTLLY